MSSRRVPAAFVSFVLSLLVAGAGCGRGDGAAGRDGAAGIVRIDGSSTVFPISEAVAEEFQQQHRGVRVMVGISGTGGGFQKFCRGETDITNASRPIKPTEREACATSGVEFIELPVAYDGLVVAVHPKNTWVDHLTVDELRRIWAPEAQGKVLRWNQVRTAWPDRELHLFGAGVDSGTYDYFTEAVVGREGASRGDFTSSEDDNVLVQGIANDELALGFFGIAYYEQNRQRLRAVPVADGSERGPVAPSVQAVKDGIYQPLSRPLFVYVSRAAAERPEIAAFVEFQLSEGDALVSEVGYVPLGAENLQLARQHFTNRVTGSAFAEGGSQVGMTVERLLARQR
jgi:phosphate transport system substrate-binding protein